MDVLSVAKQIEKIIEAIRVEGAKSKGLIKDMARAAADYDKEVEKAIAVLESMDCAVTTRKDKAKGRASEFLYRKLSTEKTLKAHFARIEYLLAQMNGYQSINKYLDNTQR